VVAGPGLLNLDADMYLPPCRLHPITAAGGAAAAGPGLLDLDADLYLAAYDQAVLLEWIDVLWSCFLEVGFTRARGGIPGRRLCQGASISPRE
jgi:hypothetical protein